MASPRKIAVITGSRAEYGLLFWLLKALQTDTAVELQLFVTGMHLSPEFGLTYQAIEADGFQITAKVETLLSSDSAIGVAKAVGLGVISFAEVFAHFKPDIIVLLGDRFEIFAAAQAAMIGRIPIAHIHGGEVTEGAIDETIRHALSKMACLHFTATEVYKKRVLQLGEPPATVFNVGALAIDNIKKLTLLDKTVLEEKIQFQLGSLNFLITYHPPTLILTAAEESLLQLLAALAHFPTAHLIFTHANADMAGRLYNQLIDNFVAEKPNTRFVTASLGQLKYLSALHLVDVVIGNSSSGIIEAPALKTPTVNIGNRQQGRIKAQSIIDAEADTPAIIAAIEQAISSAFQAHVKQIQHPYGDGQAADMIKQLLLTQSLQLTKPFHDLI